MSIQSVGERNLTIAAVVAIPFILAFTVYWDFLDLWFWTDDFIWIDAATNPNLGEAIRDAFAFPRGATPYWRPLIDLHFFSMYRLFGADGTPFHVANVLIHSASAAILGLLALRLTRSSLTAALTAGLFAISPTFATMVPWASGATALYAGLFSVIAVVLYIDVLQNDRQGWRALVAAGAFGLALLAKEDSVAVFAVLVLCTLAFRDRKELSLASARPLLPFAVVGFVYVIPQLFLVVGSSESPRFNVGWHVVPNLFEALSWLSFPWPNFEGDWVSPSRWAAFAVFLSITILSALQRRWLLPLLYAATAILLIPAAFFHGDFATRWTYLASLPWAIFIAVLMSSAYELIASRWRVVGLVAGVTVTVLLFVLLGARTIDNHVWVPRLVNEYRAIEARIVEGCPGLSEDHVVFFWRLPFAGGPEAFKNMVRLDLPPSQVVRVTRKETPDVSLTEREDVCTVFYDGTFSYVAVPEYVPIR